VVKVAFVEGADRAITGSLDQTIRTWELSSGKELVEIKGLNFGIWSETFSPDRKQALTGSNDKTIRIWSLPD
jgi:WD40 repeat protein